jgi:hypothetical protein
LSERRLDCGMAGVLLIAISGCHGGRRVEDSKLYERLSHFGRSHGASRMDEQTKAGAASVVTGCAEAPFAHVQKGLIVGETGLHEDVFEMRDRVSFATVAYGLDDTLQLEEMLQAEAKAGVHSAEQAGCIQSFAEHLEGLTDPMVEVDRLQKEIDLSGFSKAAKEVHDEKQRELETPPASNAESAQAK